MPSCFGTHQSLTQAESASQAGCALQIGTQNPVCQQKGVCIQMIQAGEGEGAVDFGQSFVGQLASLPFGQKSSVPFPDQLKPVLTHKGLDIGELPIHRFRE